MIPRRVEHPIGCFTEPAHVLQPLDAHTFTRTYIRATADPADSAGSSVFGQIADRLRSSPTWRYREVATNHMIASNRPQELTDLLLELA